jgi:hypothetical protein
VSVSGSYRHSRDDFRPASMAALGPTPAIRAEPSIFRTFERIFEGPNELRRNRTAT